MNIVLNNLCQRLISNLKEILGAGSDGNIVVLGMLVIFFLMKEEQKKGRKLCSYISLKESIHRWKKNSVR